MSSETKILLYCVMTKKNESFPFRLVNETKTITPPPNHWTQTAPWTASVLYLDGFILGVKSFLTTSNQFLNHNHVTRDGRTHELP